MRFPPAHPTRPRWYHNGVTLIEMMVTVAVLVIVASLAIPSWQTFVVRNQVGNLSGDFTRDFSRARAEAISNNQCVTICQSANTAAAAPTCTAVDDNWNQGWIAFVNTQCANAATTAPGGANRVLFVRNPGPTTLTLATRTGAATFRVMFSPKGISTLGAGGGTTLDLVYAPEVGVSEHDRTICVAATGRAVTHQAGTVCGVTR